MGLSYIQSPPCRRFPQYFAKTPNKKTILKGVYFFFLLEYKLLQSRDNVFLYVVVPTTLQMLNKYWWWEAVSLDKGEKPKAQMLFCGLFYYTLRLIGKYQPLHSNKSAVEAWGGSFQGERTLYIWDNIIRHLNSELFFLNWFLLTPRPRTWHNP